MARRTPYRSLSMLIPALLWGGLAYFSYHQQSLRIDAHLREMAVSQGALVARMIEAARLWNAGHGGLYAKVTADCPPNPYLDVADRDIKTPSGLLLTKINPAYMTRQMGEVILEQTGIRIHATSLNPLNPENQARDWEVEALRAFEQGHGSYFRMLDRGEMAQARYMTPLQTQTPCLQCHAKQGYKVGDIRGGIAVTYPISHLAVPIETQKRHLAQVHWAAWALLTGLTMLLVERVRQRVGRLLEDKVAVDRVVEERTAQLQREIAQRDTAEARLRLLINSSGEGVLELDRDGRVSLCNPASLQLLDQPGEGALLGKTIDELLHVDSLPGPEARAARMSLLSFQHGVALHRDDLHLRQADGTALSVELRIEPLYRAGEVIGGVASFNDVTERKRQEAQAWRRANYDHLTGLANRSLLGDRLEQGLAQSRRKGSQLAVLFLDLDGFKQVNDSLGHAAGDELLRQAAQRLLHAIRDSDTLARLGGDEFVVAQPLLADAKGATTLAGKLREALQAPFELGGEPFRVSASIGIALFPDHGSDAVTLLKHADTAMYQAKQAGRDTWCVFDPQMNRDSGQ